MIDLLPRLFDLQDRILRAQREAQAATSIEELSRSVRDDDGDTIFGIDLPAEAVLLPFCAELGRDHAFVLMAEGQDPAGVRFGRGEPEFRLIVDPVDGSRGLMHDKRSAWTLAAAAEERGTETRMRHVFCAAMTELPTTRHGRIDQLWATRDDDTAHGERRELATGEKSPLPVRASRAASLHNGFASVADYFAGGKELIARVAEAILIEEMGGWNPEKANVFSDQYISSGGQLAELALGRDRFVMDIRPQVYRKLGVTSSLCSRPYDLCTMLVAEKAGVIVTEPDGSRLDPPLDITTNVAFAAYANRQLFDRLNPIVHRALAQNDLLERE